MELSLKRKKRIAVMLGVVFLIFMWKSKVMYGIWWFGIPAVICSAYYAYLVMRYELTDN